MQYSSCPVSPSGRFILAAFVMIVFADCRSASTLQGPHGMPLTPTRTFSKVSVQDFTVSVFKRAEQARSARVVFPDFIVTELQKTGRFSSVARNAEPDVNTLVISGIVTRYDEGNVQKRFWLGMGFGRAFLEADVEFRDNKGVEIGKIKVDKKSWPLGGEMVASQDPHGFMYGAAGKIAKETTRMAK